MAQTTRTRACCAFCGFVDISPHLGVKSPPPKPSAYEAYRTSGWTPTSTNAVSTSESVIAYRHQSAATTEFLKAVCSVPCCSLSTPRQLSASSHPSETFTMPSTPTTLNYTSLSALTRHSALSTTVSSPSIADWTPTGFV